MPELVDEDAHEDDQDPERQDEEVVQEGKAEDGCGQQEGRGDVDGEGAEAETEHGRAV
jgi:hypothetical protein